jgi:hypothetical protein
MNTMLAMSCSCYNNNNNNNDDPYHHNLHVVNYFSPGVWRILDYICRGNSAGGE